MSRCFKHKPLGAYQSLVTLHDSSYVISNARYWMNIASPILPERRIFIYFKSVSHSLLPYSIRTMPTISAALFTV